MSGPRTFHHREYDAATLLDRKDGRRISVCLPARNEEATVAGVVSVLVEHFRDAVPLVDDIVVVDDHSEDATARLAADAGARVVDASTVLPDWGEGHGKGEALWKSMFVTDGDLIVWCDSDIRDFGPRFVTGLLGPLLTTDGIEFVKGYYDRPLIDGRPGGGRVTELVARPVLSLLFPHLATVVQPLAGEYAGTRRLFEQLPFVRGYGVDIGLLIDAAERVGIDAMAQVDLGVRTHRNRPLDQLSPQALAVLQTALHRAGDTDHGVPALLHRPGPRAHGGRRERATTTRRRSGVPPVIASDATFRPQAETRRNPKGSRAMRRVPALPWCPSPCQHGGMDASELTRLFGLDGKVAVVTGGSRGIGLMICRAFLNAGARVYLSSRKADACAAAVDELSPLGDVTALPVDLSSEAGADELAGQLAGTGGRHPRAGEQRRRHVGGTPRRVPGRRLRQGLRHQRQGPVPPDGPPAAPDCGPRPRPTIRLGC